MKITRDLSFIGMMKDKTYEGNQRFVLHRLDEGQNVRRTKRMKVTRDLSFISLMKDKTYERNQRFVLHKHDEGQNK
jgi:hypothetical protein